MSAVPPDEERHDHEEGLVTASPENMTEASDSGDEEDGPVEENGNARGGEGKPEEGTEEETDEDDEEEDEDDDEDDDEEPALKYERLGGIAHQLLQKDSASALAYSNQRLVSDCIRIARK